MLHVASEFQDYMVLQRNKVVRVFGTANVGEQIWVSFGGESQRAITDSQGLWEVFLPPMEAAWDLCLRIDTTSTSVIISHVAIGDVYVAAGQSNMEFHMRYEKHIEEVRPELYRPGIRFYDIPEITYGNQMGDFDYSRMGVWRVADEDNIDYFSAVAYYFADVLEKNLEIPIGIIGCNYGGTTLAAWCAPKTFDGAGKAWKERFRKESQLINWRNYWKEQKKNPQNNRGNPFENPFSEAVMPKTVTVEELYQIFEGMGEYNPDATLQPTEIPSILYTNMTKVAARFKVSGILWYQGESDADARMEAYYYDMLQSLIRDWRECWAEEIPFFIVQLPGLEKWLDLEPQNYSVIREAQAKIVETIPKTYLCSISDIGEQYDIHPKEKRLVGQRLGAQALHYIYHKDLLCDAPRLEYAECVDEHQIILNFRNAGEGLSIRGDVLQAMFITQDDQQITWSASAMFNQLIIKTEQMLRGNIHVQFAQTQWFVVNLYNSAGIPAVPFDICI